MSDGISDNIGYCSCGPDMEPCGACGKIRWTMPVEIDGKSVELCETCRANREAQAKPEYAVVGHKGPESFDSGVLVGDGKGGVVELPAQEGLRPKEVGAVVAPAKQGKSLLQEIAKGPTLQIDDELSDYRRQREALAAKFGGLIPIAEGEIVACDIAQEGSADAFVRLTIKTATFDQLAIMAAPNHKMKILLFEDRRKR